MKNGEKHTEKSRTRMRLNHRTKHGFAVWNKGLTKELDKRIEYNRPTVFKRGMIPWSKGKHINFNPSGSFKKGQIPWNKGKKGTHFSSSTEFRKGQTPWIKGKHHTELTKRVLSEKRMLQKIPKHDTTIEILLQKYLNMNKIRFRTHEPIKGQPDIFIEPNICIFADGCYWHGCEFCLDRNKHSEIIKSKKIKDLNITRELEKHGYIVLRFWEHEIESDLELCLQRVKEVLRVDT